MYNFQNEETLNKAINSPNIGRPRYKWNLEAANDLADKMNKFYEDNPESHLFVDFQAKYRIHDQTIATLRKRYPSFDEHIKSLKPLLESRCCKKGAEARNPAWFIFTEKAHYGRSDQVNINVSGTISHQHVEAASLAWQRRQQLIKQDNDDTKMIEDNKVDAETHIIEDINTNDISDIQRGGE